MHGVPNVNPRPVSSAARSSVDRRPWPSRSMRSASVALLLAMIAAAALITSGCVRAGSAPASNQLTQLELSRVVYPTSAAGYQNTRKQQQTMTIDLAARQATYTDHVGKSLVQPLSSDTIAMIRRTMNDRFWARAPRAAALNRRSQAQQMGEIEYRLQARNAAGPAGAPLGWSSPEDLPPVPLLTLEELFINMHSRVHPADRRVRLLP